MVSRVYQEGRDSGLKEGRDSGLKEGRDSGLKEGRDSGLKEGRDSGLKEGRDLGLKEGLTAGHDLGLKDAVRKMLERRFGPLLSAATSQRLEAMTESEIETIIDRIFTVNSLAELGL